MVFGWGKKKQEESHDEEIPTDKEISLSDVPKIVADLEHLRKSQTLSEIKHLRDNTEPLIDDLIKIGNLLEKDNLKVDDIDKHLAIIVVRGKKQVIDIIKKGVVHLPEISSINDVENLNFTLNQILKKVGDVLGRQTRVIHIFAKKYANQLKENLEVMNNNHSEIRKLTRNYDSTKTMSGEIIDALKEIDAKRHSQIENKQKIVEIKQNIESITETISSLKSSIEKIKSSDNYKKYLELKNAIDLFHNHKLKIKNDIDAQFTKISRPLNRYEYGSSLDKDQKNLLTKLIKEPFDVILPQNKDSIIVILENVRKGISSGSISVKDIDKSLSYLTETEEALDGFVKQVSEYLERRKKMMDDLSSLASDELASLERDVAKNISYKENFQLKLKTIQDNIDEIDARIPMITSKIEENLRHFSNTRYILLPS